MCGVLEEEHGVQRHGRGHTEAVKRGLGRIAHTTGIHSVGAGTDRGPGLMSYHGPATGTTQTQPRTHTHFRRHYRRRV
jgi:hypothetical protein